MHDVVLFMKLVLQSYH